ncbi:uncharacterized protein LOC134190485 isoform X2 [Corticium candelabrum]|nr:uncharacterized protein LOC134190485 isoform X2 [Corticium candelabrum]XP_062514919.1 uncharacterized protein LOC134190485 isoform X2 [Corticium candelabrum]
MVFHVSKALPEFEDQIQKTLSAHISAGKTRIHYRFVDDLIFEDFNSSPTSAFTIYLLAFPTIMQSTVKPSYWYSLNSDSGCGTTVWTGKERYLWIDLSAGPVGMFTVKENSNIVNQWTLPRLEHYGSSTNFRDNEFTTAVASLLTKIGEQVIVPSLQYARPFTDARQITLQLIVISDDLSTLVDRAVSHSIDWQLFRDTIGRLALYGQKLLYKVTPLVLESCPHCVASFSHALATKVQALSQNSSSVVTHQYLDSIELHHWLLQFRKSFGLQPLPGLSMSPFNKFFTLPIFLFDLSGYHSLLLDDGKQAVSFEDMVIAVRTPSSRQSTGFHCTGNKPDFDTSEVTRPVLASLFESLYGLLPTEYFLKNGSHVDYLWAAGLTPFGYLSSSKEISFALREAALRAPVLLNVDWSMTILSKAIDHYQEFGVEICAALSKFQCSQFAMRWHLLQYKLTHTMSLLSVGNYHIALYFSRSLRLEIVALRIFLKEAETSIYPRLRCEGVPLSMWSLPGLLVMSCMFVALVLVIASLYVVITRTGILAMVATPHLYTKPKVV